MCSRKSHPSIIVHPRPSHPSIILHNTVLLPGCLCWPQPNNQRLPRWCWPWLPRQRRSWLSLLDNTSFSTTTTADLTMSIYHHDGADLDYHDVCGHHNYHSGDNYDYHAGVDHDYHNGCDHCDYDDGTDYNPHSLYSTDYCRVKGWGGPVKGSSVQGVGLMGGRETCLFVCSLWGHRERVPQKPSKHHFCSILYKTMLGWRGKHHLSIIVSGGLQLGLYSLNNQTNQSAKYANHGKMSVQCLGRREGVRARLVLFRG